MSEITEMANRLGLSGKILVSLLILLSSCNGQYVPTTGWSVNALYMYCAVSLEFIDIVSATDGSLFETLG